MNAITETPQVCGRPHIHRHRIAFSECDPAQIVFFAIHDPDDKRRIKSIPISEDIKAACVRCRAECTAACRRLSLTKSPDRGGDRLLPQRLPYFCSDATASS